jgi:hypothetical protein
MIQLTTLLKALLRNPIIITILVLLIDDLVFELAVEFVAFAELLPGHA